MGSPTCKSGTARPRPMAWVRLSRFTETKPKYLNHPRMASNAPTDTPMAMRRERSLRVAVTQVPPAKATTEVRRRRRQ